MVFLVPGIGFFDLKLVSYISGGMNVSNKKLNVYIYNIYIYPEDSHGTNGIFASSNWWAGISSIKKYGMAILFHV